MTADEFKLYAQTMKQYNISFFRMGQVQIVMGEKRITENQEPSELESEPMKHKLEQMTSVMKLSDEELVNKLFPVEEDERA